jgi:hypothetical protein
MLVLQGIRRLVLRRLRLALREIRLVLVSKDK